MLLAKIPVCAFGVEESCSSIANYNIPLPIKHSLEHLRVTNATSL